jgi:hypothetical protein
LTQKIFLTFFLTSLSLNIFTIWKCIAYNRFCREGIYFDNILVSEYKLLISMLEFLIDNIFVSFGGTLFQQVVGIPMGTNCAPLLAD